MSSPNSTLTETVRGLLSDRPKTLDELASKAKTTDTVGVILALGDLKTRGIAVCTPGEGLLADTWSLAHRPR